MTPDDQRTFIGQFKLDPRDGEFQALKSVCEPGNPWRCLIATSASIHLGKRMTVRVDHENKTGVIGITEGDLRWERPMTKQELSFATRFDLGEDLPKPLTVKVDLRDPAWEAKPKRGADGVRPGGPRSKIRNGNAKPHTKSIRARQLAAIRAAYAPEGATQ